MSVFQCACLCAFKTMTYSGALKLTSSVLVAEVREAPHVAQANSESHAGHDEVHLSGPGFSLPFPSRHGPVPGPRRGPVLDLRWASPSTLSTPWVGTGHRHQGTSWPPALLLGQGACLHLGDTDFIWTRREGSDDKEGEMGVRWKKKMNGPEMDLYERHVLMETAKKTVSHTTSSLKIHSQTWHTMNEN